MWLTRADEGRLENFRNSSMKCFGSNANYALHSNFPTTDTLLFAQTLAIVAKPVLVVAGFRDEDYHILSKCKRLLKHEGNDFLGQKLIDFRTLVGETDLWYTLGIHNAAAAADDDDNVAMATG